MTKDIPFGTGVIVVKDGRILAGTRTDNGMICGPGGHILEGEDIPSAARREAQEEFSIVPGKMVSLGAIKSPEGKYRPSMVYLCTDYVGEPKADEKEMVDAKFIGIDELLQMSNLFPCFAASLALLMDRLGMHVDGGEGSGRYPKGGGKANGAPVDSEGKPYKFKAVRMSKKEYGKISSEISTNYSKYEGKKLCIHRSYGIDKKPKAYYFENHGFNEYNFYRIKKNEE